MSEIKRTVTWRQMVDLVLDRYFGVWETTAADERHRLPYLIIERPDRNRKQVKDQEGVVIAEVEPVVDGLWRVVWVRSPEDVKRIDAAART